MSEARGIVIDVTESSRDGFLDEATFSATDSSAGGLDRVAELALALFSSAEGGLPRHGFERLKPLLEALRFPVDVHPADVPVRMLRGYGGLDIRI